ncbi:hypothetical protein Tco_0045189 [Tanacetum coccineum]
MSIPYSNQGPPPAGPPPQNNNGPPPLVRPNGPALDLRLMEELFQPSINGRGGPIAPIPIQATDFGLRHHMIQQVQNSCQFHKLPGDDANRHIDKFLEVTQHMKQNGVFDDALRLSLFSYSLTHHATAWHRDTINAAAGGTFMQKTSEESYDLIGNMIAHHNHWDTSATQDETSRTISSTTTTESPEVRQSPSGLGSLPSNIIANPRGDLKAITTRSGVSYDGPMIPPTSSPLPKEVECEPEATKDKVQTTNLGSTAHVQPLVFQVPITKPDVAPKHNPKPLILYPLRLNDQKLCEKANYQMLKFLQIFQRLHFDLSFVDALLHIPKFASTFKSLLSNKEKLFELANTLLNENCLVVLLKKLPKKLGDPDRFLIPYDFPELDKCLALADLGTSINLMPLSVWKKLSLLELTPTRMTLEFANRSIAYPVVVDYDVDPPVPLILGRPFLRTARTLIDVHREELILIDGDEQLIFHVDNTSKHPNKHESINMTNFIDITCEDRFSEVLKFKKSNHPSSGSTTPLSDTLLEEFAGELALLGPFPPGNKDDNFDPEADLREIEYLMNQDPSTESSPKSNIEIIDPIIERFIDEPAHVYPPLPRDENDDNDDLFMISLLVLLTMRPEDSLIMGDEDLYTILEKESDEFIKSSVEDLVPIPSESEDTSDSDKECDLPFCDNSVTFSNPLFDANDDFTSSDVESLPEEDVQEENFKIYSNLLFEFDDEYISITYLPDNNEDECFYPRGDMDEIDAFLGIDVSTDIEDGYHDSEGDIIYLESLLINYTIPNLPPEVFLDIDPKSLKDEHDNDNLTSMVKVFDLGIHEKIISLTYVRLPFKDRHYFSLTFVIKVFLPFLTYLVNSLPILSSGSEDLIFDLDISAYSLYSLESVAYENPMKNFLFFCFCPKDKGIRGESS